ncbi:general secretion pathway protein GspN [Dyella subtropica]|uniref:general secretion pathway protein GspN n=1 Tax=Dyella subtropica TaxID=2992127 RepID=UPI00225B62F1|nr:general secretion pathway protein GspN [Dyella subtropica]
MNAATQRRLTPLLAGVAIALALLLVLLLGGIGRGVHWNPPRPTPPLPDTRASSSLPVPVPIAQFATVWQQPVFNPDRKPAMRSAKGGASLGEMQLTGIILTPALHMALLHTRSGGNDVRVREGDSLPDGSWKLVELKSRSAVFESSSGRTELELPAGAPIDMPKNEAQAQAPNPGGAAIPGPVVVPAGAMQRVGPASSNPPRMPLNPASAAAPPPNADSNAPRPQQDESGPQAERLRQLRSAIQKRRAEQAAGTPEGVH